MLVLSLDSYSDLILELSKWESMQNGIYVCCLIASIVLTDLGVERKKINVL